MTADRRKRKTIYKRISLMNDINKKDFKVLHDLIDELAVYISLLNDSPRDSQMVELFGRRFFRSGRLLYASGYPELSELAFDIHDVFGRVFNRSIYITHEILRMTLSFLTLARKVLIFSDASGFREASGPMILELRLSLNDLRESIDSSKNNFQ